MITLHRADWVVPVSTSVIANGGVAVKGDRIIDIGPFAQLAQKFPDATVITHSGCALTPPLINGHIHLELSHIPIPQQFKKVTGFTDWINTLLTLRAEKGDVGEAVENAARETLQDQFSQGVIALGDIGNTDIGSRLQKYFKGEIFHFNERLGRSNKSRRIILDEITKAPTDSFFTAHAPYSTHPELIQALKHRAATNNQPFPIHVAEPPSEIDMLCNGNGKLFEFLRKRNFIDDTFKPPAAIDNCGSVQYLHSLEVLDNRTICVHCIHVTPEEITLLAESGSHVCLCPGSNQYLHVGNAPVAQFLKEGIMPALGTDSLASNPKLSIWREMKICHDTNPNVKHADIFSMATQGGAAALGIDDRYGSLAAGKSSHFLAVPLPEKIRDESKVFTYLVEHQDHQPTWVNQL